MKKYIIITVLATIICSATVIYAASVYTDLSGDDDETVKEIQKVVDVPATTATTTIDMGLQIDKMADAQDNIEKILARFNKSREYFNEGLAGLESATKPLAEATCSFPDVPTKVNK